MYQQVSAIGLIMQQGGWAARPRQWTIETVIPAAFSTVIPA